MENKERKIDCEHNQNPVTFCCDKCGCFVMPFEGKYVLAFPSRTTSDSSRRVD